MNGSSTTTTTDRNHCDDDDGDNDDEEEEEEEEVKEKKTSEESNKPSPSVSSSEKMASSRCLGRRGRRPAKLDTRVRLERSQQSARECRARKKLRYQYLEELVSSREKAIYILRQELELYRKYCQDIDGGVMPKEVEQMISNSENK